MTVDILQEHLSLSATRLGDLSDPLSKKTFYEPPQ